MGYQDALKDKIHVEIDGQGFTYYYPPCHICGENLRTWNYNPNVKYTCRECKKLLVEQKLIMQLENTKIQKLNVAVKRISKKSNIKNYEKAIKIIEKSLSEKVCYQSTEEIMVALELTKRNIQFKYQVKILSYCVDFLLPEYKVVLEIDAPIFHGKDKASYQFERDKDIVNTLGPDWEVIRISTEYINMNVTRIMKAINAILKRRKLQKK